MKPAFTLLALILLAAFTTAFADGQIAIPLGTGSVTPPIVPTGLTPEAAALLDDEWIIEDEWDEAAMAQWAEKEAVKKAEARKQKRAALEGILPLVESTQKFSFAFYQEILKDHADENLFFSPMSLHFGLSMTAMGAKGKTQKQMLDALHIENFEKQRFQEFGKYFRYSKQQHEEVYYFMVNRFWCDPASPILPAFKKDLKDYFDADIAAMNLKKEPEASRKAINEIIAKDTQQRVTDLLPPDSITPDSACVLANIMLFHGLWLFTFEEKDTRPEPFFLADGTQKETPMMSLEKGFEVYREETFQAVSLTYKDWSRRCSMVILLPNEKTGLPALEEKLSPEFLEKITEKMRERTVNLKMPKFRVDTSLDLKPCLKRMGITDAFSSAEADFTGISDKSPWLGGAVHGASVDVDENGTRAVAATADWLLLCDFDEATVKFHADHPFLFFIRDDVTGAILFMGRFVSP